MGDSKEASLVQDNICIPEDYSPNSAGDMLDQLREDRDYTLKGP